MQGTMDTFRWEVVYLAFVQKAKNHEGTLQALRRLANRHMAINEEETAHARRRATRYIGAGVEDTKIAQSTDTGSI